MPLPIVNHPSIHPSSSLLLAALLSLTPSLPNAVHTSNSNSPLPPWCDAKQICPSEPYAFSCEPPHVRNNPHRNRTQSCYQNRLTGAVTSALCVSVPCPVLSCLDREIFVRFVPLRCVTYRHVVMKRPFGTASRLGEVSN